MVFFSKARGLVAGFGLVVIGIGCIVYGMIVLSNLRKPAEDLYQVDWETLHANQHIMVDLEFLGGIYMIRSENGKVKSQFYVVPEIQADQESLYFSHFIGLAAAGEDTFAVYDRISKDSYDFWNDETGLVEYAPETVHLDGYLRKMTKNDKKYMTEYLQEMGYSDEEINQVMVPFVLMTNGNSMTGITIAGAVVVLFGGVILAITFIRIKKDKEINDAISGSFGASSYGGTGYSGTAGGAPGYYNGSGKSGKRKNPFL